MRAAVTPDAAANAYPQRAPKASKMNPAAVEPHATPTEMPVDSHDMASVARPGLEVDSSRLYPAMSVGAIVIPHKKITRVSTSRFGIAQNVHTPATVSGKVTASRCHAGARQVLDPYQRPPVPLPSAEAPSMTPASALWPKRVAHAKVR